MIQILHTWRSRRPGVSQAGYTFIEMAVTLSIVGVVSATGMTRVPRLLSSYNVSGSATQVVNDLRLARMRAVTQNARARLRFTGASTYVRERESPAGSNAYVTDGPPNTLPTGVSVSVTPGTPTYDSRGLATQQYTLTVTNSYGTTRTVTVTGIGRVNLS